MIHKSVSEVYQLSDLRAGYPHAILPTDVIAVPDEEASHRIILSYDYRGKGRIDFGFPRREPSCTHINLTLLEGLGVPPLCVAFSAKCLIEKFEDGKFVYVHEDLAHERAVFSRLDKTDNIKIIARPGFWKTVTGITLDESDRICEAFQSRRVTELQFMAVKDAVSEWAATQDRYGLNRRNCQTLVENVLGIGASALLTKSVITYLGRQNIPLRPHSNSIHYPGWDQAQIEEKSQGQLKVFPTGWVVQPSAVTRNMAKKAYKQLHDREMGRHDEEIDRIVKAKAATAQSYASALSALER